MKRINLAWWNVGISPPILGSLKEKINELDAVREFLSKLSMDNSIDFFVFCEVSSKESSVLASVAEELDLVFCDLSGRDGRLVMDMSLMYESSKLEYISHKYINAEDESGSMLRIGVKVIFKELINNEYITFFLSHWNSKLSLDEEDRIFLSVALRNEINSIFEKYGDNSNIILLGDYNTNPYSRSIHEGLKTTKDYLLIKNNVKKRRLLFNPFWKCILDDKYHCNGSYYFNDGKYDRWSVFDQMMFSSSFVKNQGVSGALRLDLDSFKCHPMFNYDIMNIHDMFISQFDHAPIFGSLYYDE